MNEDYELKIYTWPGFCGASTTIRSSFHDTPESAVAKLDTETEPYAYACLQRYAGQGAWMPCDWNGRFVSKAQEWPIRRGTNGLHPDYVAFKRDIPSLLDEIRRIYNEHGGAMAEIATELMHTRHPNVQGWGDSLGWAAASDMTTIPNIP